MGVQGDSVKIECASFAIPKLDQITWTFEGREIDAIHDQVSDQFSLLFERGRDLYKEILKKSYYIF